MGDPYDWYDIHHQHASIVSHSLSHRVSGGKLLCWHPVCSGILVQEDRDWQADSHLCVRGVCWHHDIWIHAICHDRRNGRKERIGGLVLRPLTFRLNCANRNLGVGSLSSTASLPRSSQCTGSSSSRTHRTKPKLSIFPLRRKRGVCRDL
jgi:hypothetical protein